MIAIAALLATVLVIGVIAPLLGQRGERGGVALSLIPLALAAFFLWQLIDVGDGARDLTYEWVPALGVDFALRFDGLSLLFALLISGIGFLIVLYSASYMSHSASPGRFYALLLFFMASMLGLVLADNLITLVLFWEMTSISSFGLISVESEKPRARAAATQALFVTGAGGLAMLGGFVLLGMEAGTMSISELVAGGSIAGSDLYLPILLLVLLGAFTKSAQVPFHFWLPNAMEAPTPVSAYLHSATMVKAGVYLLARMMPVLGGTDEWFYIVSIAGGATMLLGAALAIAHTDLKRILAYSTLSILGALVMLLGIGTEGTVVAAMVLLVAHAGYKAALFLCAGIIDHETHTRDVREVSGLRHAMPWTTACVLIAGLSMAGIAPLFGFIVKESVYESLLHAERLVVAGVIAAVAANALMAGVALVLFVRPFLGPLRTPGGHVHEAGPLLLAAPVLLGCFGLLMGLAPAIVNSTIENAAAAILAAPTEASLRLWHGFNLALALSGVTLAAGGGLYLARDRLAAPILAVPLSAEKAYDGLMNGLLRGAELQTRVLQHGYLRVYVAVIVAATVLLAGGTALLKADLRTPAFEPTPRLDEVAVMVLIMAGALLAVLTASRIVAIIALGLVGYGVALVYALFGAPDLAVTQILVETLTVLLMVFAFYRLPRFASYSRPTTRMRDAGLAAMAGVTISVLLFTALTVDADRSLSQRLAEISKPEAFGGNVVNVILVDFRALDTLGEITVLAVAAIGIIALLRGAARARQGGSGPNE